MDFPQHDLSLTEKTNEDLFAFPISLAQRRLWFLDQLLPGNPAYNITLALRISGSLNATAVERALNEIVARHESLRTTFDRQSSEPVQIVAPGCHCKLPLTDLSEMGGAERESTAQSLVAEEQLEPFDLQRGPLLRVRLIRLTQREHVLSLTMHHIVSDGWSMQVFIREFCALYEDFAQGRPSSLSPLPIQLADFALWQQEAMSTDGLRGHLSYWTEQLKSVEPLQLRTDRSRPAIQSSNGARVVFSLSRNISDKVRQLSRHENVTPFMTLLAGYMVLLYRYTQQEDISVGSPVANRSRIETEGLIGFLASTIVLRGDLSGNPTYRELLQRIRKTAMEGYKHQDVHFEKLIEVMHPERDIGRNPLFQVSFALDNDISNEVRLLDLHLAPFLFPFTTAPCLTLRKGSAAGWFTTRICLTPKLLLGWLITTLPCWAVLPRHLRSISPSCA